MTKQRIILDLCGGTGSWSRPYVDAGYDVRVVTLPDCDVRDYEPPTIVHGILAAPPCTHFSISGARWWKGKDATGVTREGVDIVRACIRIILTTRPAWFAIENPVGRIAKLVPELGVPSLSFQPWEYGDPWLTRTMVWGQFKAPLKIDGATKPEYKTEKRWQRSLTNHLSPKPTAEQIGCLAASGMLPPDWIHQLGPSPERATLRSITPPGFARAFFEANP